MDQDVLLAALHDDVSRKILQESAAMERSADDLAERIGVSPSTIYRRVETLSENDLLVEGIEIDEGGHHRTVYQSAISTVEIDINEEGIQTRVQWREDMADRLTRIWEEIRRDR